MQLVDVMQRDIVFPTEAAMHYEYALFQYHAERQQVEDVLELLIQQASIFLPHFLCEAVNFVHVRALMVTPVDNHGPRALQLESEEKQENLHRAPASIRNVAIEKIPAVARPALLEDS